MNTIFDEIAAKRTAMNEAILAQQVEIEQMLTDAKASAMEADMAKLEELKALAEGFNANFQLDIEVELGLKEPPKSKKAKDASARVRTPAVAITEESIKKFVEVKASNPNASLDALKVATGLNKNTLKKLERKYEASDHTFEDLASKIQQSA